MLKRVKGKCLDSVWTDNGCHDFVIVTVPEAEKVLKMFNVRKESENRILNCHLFWLN